MAGESQKSGGSQTTAGENRNWLTSTVLVLLTLLVAVACVVALACTLTQTRVASIAIDGVGLSVPKLDYVGRVWAVHRQESRKLAMLEEGVLDARQKHELAKMKFTSIDRVFESKLNSLSFGINKIVPGLLTDTVGLVERHDQIIGSKELLVQKDDRFRDRISELESAFEARNRAFANLADADVAGAGLSAELDLAQKRVEKTETTLFDYIKPGLDKDAKARVENAFYELNIDKFDCGKGENTECGPFGGLIARGLYHILTLRPDLLTLCLGILMGILGSTLQITHAYFMKNERQDIGGYFQRVAVGAMTALVIFIVAKAGVPVLADTSKLGGDAPINPYLISFLAIVSGLLSENAIANIQAQGRRFLGADAGGPKRWAQRDLTSKLQAQNMSTDALARHLGVDKSVAEAMLKGSSPMDAQQQQIVALSLREEPRLIFTDIAPPLPEPAG